MQNFINKKTTPKNWMAFYFIGYFFTYAVYTPFWGVWLKDLGLSSEEIGVLLGIGLATRCFANLFITPRVHKAGQLLPFIRIISFFSLVCFGGYFVFTSNYIWLITITILFSLSLAPGIPMGDVLGNYYAKNGRVDYGRSRLLGSIAFVAGMLIVGAASEKFGIWIIPYIGMMSLFFSMLVVLRVPSLEPQDDNTKSDNTRVNVLKILVKPQVLIFLAIQAFIQGSHGGYYSFSALYWQKIGFGENLISFLWTMGVIGEILVFAFNQRLFKGISNKAMMYLAAGGTIVRWSMTAWIDLWYILAIVQLLHGLTFATAHLAAIRYIQTLPVKYMIVLQSLYNALCTGVIIAIVTSLSGWIYAWNATYLFWIMAVVGMPALLLIPFLKNKLVLTK